MRLVIIESPYAGDVERNKAYLQRCILDCLERGEAPFASHQMYTTALDDTIPDQRGLGIEAGFEWAGQADLVAIYADLGISDGMVNAIYKHGEDGRPIEIRRIGA